MLSILHFLIYLCVKLKLRKTINMKQTLDEFDKKILQMISDDARIAFLEVARACNVSGAAIHQRVQRLTQMGVIKGSQFILNPEEMGFQTTAFVGLNLKNPEKFEETVKAIKAIPEIVECHFTTGNYDLFLKLYATDNNALLKLIHNKLRPLGLSHTETIISLNTEFSRQLSPSCIEIETEEN